MKISIITLVLLAGALFTGACQDKTAATKPEENSAAVARKTPDSPSDPPAASFSSQPPEAASEEPAPVQPTRAAIKVPRGTAIHVRLLNAVSSSTSRHGDRFDAEVANPVIVDGITVIAARSRVRGHVTASRSSGRLRNPGYVSIVLDSFRTSDGRWVNIDTTAVSRAGASHKKRNLSLIGGIAAAGAAIGAIAGGGKGAAIGAAAGGGAGTAGAYATGKKDVSFPVESRLIFRLKKPVTLNG